MSFHPKASKCKCVYVYDWLTDCTHFTSAVNLDAEWVNQECNVTVKKREVEEPLLMGKKRKNITRIIVLYLLLLWNIFRGHPSLHWLPCLLFCQYFFHHDDSSGKINFDEPVLWSSSTGMWCPWFSTDSRIKKKPLFVIQGKWRETKMYSVLFEEEEDLTSSSYSLKSKGCFQKTSWRSECFFLMFVVCPRTLIFLCVSIVTPLLDRRKTLYKKLIEVQRKECSLSLSLFTSDSCLYLMFTLHTWYIVRDVSVS